MLHYCNHYEGKAMSKRDFELIATTIREHKQGKRTMRLADSLADALATTNSRFDRKKFIAACSVHDSTGFSKAGS